VSYFLSFLQSVYKNKEDDLKQISIALRVALNADDKSFNKFISNNEYKKLKDDDLINL
jgi:hypothetical protein